MADSITYDSNGDARSFNGRGAVNVFAMAALAVALRAYARHRIQMNRAYTPTAMMRAARAHLGDTAKGIKARDYLGMSYALDARVQTEKTRIAEETSR